MNFSAVKNFFKPVSSAELDELARKHASHTRGEQSVCLEEVGLDRTAREAVARVQPPSAPAIPHYHEA